MLRKLKLFASDRSGNVAIITAGSLSILVMLGAGATDIARVNKVRSSMQASADAALITALRLKTMRWGKRVKFANEFFEDNFSHTTMVTGLKSKLSGKKLKKRFIFRFETSAKMTQLLPGGLSFADNKIHVSSTAEISARTNFEPRIIAAPAKSVSEYRSSNL